jgi:hypothetical protein
MGCIVPTGNRQGLYQRDQDGYPRGGVGVIVSLASPTGVEVFVSARAPPGSTAGSLRTRAGAMPWSLDIEFTRILSLGSRRCACRGMLSAAQ